MYSVSLSNLLCKEIMEAQEKRKKESKGELTEFSVL